MTIKNIQEAEAALLPFVPLVASFEGKGTNLERIRPLIELLGNPQDRLRVIHLAGTSGKTSTAYYMATLLKASGRRVGLAVSPHVDSITERVQLDGRPLSEAEFCQDLGDFLELVRRAEQQPSYFELLYAFAMWVFDRRQVDYAVVETGMGGLLDATNVITRPDKVCIITDIGFDHMHLLGNTLQEIAAQKIGIVHPGNHVFTYRQPDEVMQVFERWITEQPASLHVVEAPVEPPAPTMPNYQWRNWNLAHNVYDYLQERDNLPQIAVKALQKTQATLIPARMEIRHLAGKTLVMDGAHNAQKMATLLDSFQQLFPGIKPAVLLALKSGKEYQAVTALLAPRAARVITTVFDTSQDLPAVSMDPAVLAAAFREQGLQNVQSIADQQTAFQVILQTPESVCLITGSFYLLSQLRRHEQLT